MVKKKPTVASMIVGSRAQDKNKLVVGLKIKGRKLVSKVCQLARQIAELKGEQERLLGRLHRYAYFEYKRKSKREHRPHLIIEGENGSQVSFLWKHRYSRISISLISRIEELVGKQFRALFMRKKRITLKEDALNNPEFMKRLFKACGGELESWFQVDEWLEPTRSFTESRRILLSRETNKALDEVVVQSKPCVEIG